MTTEATTTVRARSADGRFVSKAVAAAAVATEQSAIPENLPDAEKTDAKKHGKKADSKKHGKKADSKKHGKKADSKKHGKKADARKADAKKAKSKSGGKKK
jgi:hypothetical protein